MDQPAAIHDRSIGAKRTDTPHIDVANRKVFVGTGQLANVVGLDGVWPGAHFTIRRDEVTVCREQVGTATRILASQASPYCWKRFRIAP